MLKDFIQRWLYPLHDTLTAYMGACGFILYGDKGGAPDAPDYSKIAESNEQAAQYAKQAADNDLAFRKQQYSDAQPQIQNLYSIASQVGQQQLAASQQTQNQAQEQWGNYQSTYQPIELQSVLDSLGAQYLSSDDVQSAINALTNPQYDTTPIYSTRQIPHTDYIDEVTNSTTTNTPSAASGPAASPVNLSNGLANKGSQPQAPVAAPGPTTTNTTTTTKKPVTSYTSEQYQSGENKEINKEYEAQRATLINQLAQKAQEGAAARAGEQVQAQSNSAFAQQARNLARSGMNPARMQAAAAALGQQQTLTNVGAMNTARQKAAADQISLRAGVANFGRNMPNTAGQNYGLSGQLGANAVGSANTGAQGNLGYSNYVSGGYGNQIASAGLQQQGNLGMGGLMNSTYGAGLNYASNQGSFLGGAMGLVGSLGSAAILASDRSIKQNIVQIGRLDNGLPIYVFEYKPEYQHDWGNGMRVGVMADEVEDVFPEAVYTHPTGYKMVNYERIGA